MASHNIEWQGRAIYVMFTCELSRQMGETEKPPVKKLSKLNEAQDARTRGVNFNCSDVDV